MKSDSVTLIVGVNSTIGRGLFTHLQQAGERVAGTTRRDEDLSSSCIHLDLAQDIQDWECVWSVRTAVLCGGITNMEACQKDPEGTARINVHATVALARQLASRGAFVIFPSTNQVFDGTSPQVLPISPRRPANEYGRQKAQAEELLAGLGNSCAVVRFTKVLGPDHSLIRAWARDLANGAPIRPFRDLRFSPVPLSCVVSVLRLISDRKLPGLWQVSGDRDISYADCAYEGARRLGADADLVQPVEAYRTGLVNQPFPLHTTLNIDRLRAVFGLVPPNVLDTVGDAFIAG